MTKTIGIIGCGNMGAAIVRQLINRESSLFAKILIAEKDPLKNRFLKDQQKIELVESAALAEQSNVIVIAVKPQDFDEALLEIKLGLKGRKDVLLVSIAAGITTSYIEKKVGNVAVVRVMPNLPAQVAKGVSALAKGKHASANDLKTAENIFNLVGETLVVEEKQIDAITAISGSGPAYVFYFAHCLMKAAQAQGLQADLAKELVFQTIFGALSLAVETNTDLDELIKHVTSKGGTTEAAFKVFHKKGFEKIIKEATSQAKKRAGELSRK